MRRYWYILCVSTLMALSLLPPAWGATWAYKSATLELAYVVVTVEDTSEPDTTTRRTDTLRFSKTDSARAIKAAIKQHVEQLNARDSKVDVTTTYNPEK